MWLLIRNSYDGRDSDLAGTKLFPYSIDLESDGRGFLVDLNQGLMIHDPVLSLSMVNGFFPF